MLGGYNLKKYIQTMKTKIDDFNSDLTHGIKIEDHLRTYVISKILKKFKKFKTLKTGRRIEEVYGGANPHICNENYKKWDFSYYYDKDNIQQELLIELKSEKRFTGNLYIMYEKYGKDAGVITSEAELFIYYFEDKKRMYIMNMNEVQALIEFCLMEKKFNKHKKILKNNKNDNKAYLFNISSLRLDLKLFIEIEMDDKMNIIKINK